MLVRVLRGITIREIAVFLAVGGTSYITYLIVFSVLSSRLSNFWCATSAFVVATLTHFLLNKYVTFARRNSAFGGGMVVRYVLLIAMSYLVQTLIVLTLLRVSIALPVAVAAGVLATTMLSFLGSSFWVFGGTNGGAGNTAPTESR